MSGYQDYGGGGGGGGGGYEDAGGYDDYTGGYGGGGGGGGYDNSGYDSQPQQGGGRMGGGQDMGGQGGGGGAGGNAASNSENFLLPDSVKDFVFDLHDSMRRSQRVDELEVLYADTGKKLSEAYFKSSPWPLPAIIADQCDNDEVFLCFYSEMRARHAMSVLPKGVTLEDKHLAWTNYCKLFDTLLDCRDTDMVISPQWAFDIIHEFVYQFQGFCQYRTQLDKRTPDEIATLTANQDVWAVQNVISYLHGLIRVSHIVPILEATKATDKSIPVPSPPSQLHQTMGYMAIIGMSRLQCLLGDYYDCLGVLEPIDLADKSGLFASNIMSHISTYMHMGHSFLMLRRYRDATKVFNQMLVHVMRVSKSGQLQRSGLADQVSKYADKLLALLTISNLLGPGMRIDDQVNQTMKDKHRDAIERTLRGEVQALADLFRWAAPKTIVSAIPDYPSGSSTANVVVDRQVNLFKKELQQQIQFPQVRSYLKLYTTISMDKMARFNGLTDDQFRQMLTSFKSKMLQTEWGVASDVGPLEGKPRLAVDFNFYVEGDHINIDEAAKEQRFDNYFLKQIKHCDNIIGQVARVKL